MQKTQNILPADGEVYFYPQLFSLTESNHLYTLLQNNVEWKREPIKIMGKEIMQPRLTAWYGDSDKRYSYSGITMLPQAWTKELLLIKERVEKISKQTFTSALLNFYRNGNDSMGWHRDNEKELGINPVIGSLSFGTERTFQLKHVQDKKIVETLKLSPGSFLLMKGATQHNWYHRIPKEPKIAEGRINITFRAIVG